MLSPLRGRGARRPAEPEPGLAYRRTRLGSALLHMHSYSSLQIKYKITSFPLMLQLEALSLKILFTSPMTFAIFFSLALASFVTYTSPLCYLTIISLKIRQIHLQPCLLYLWEKKKNYSAHICCIENGTATDQVREQRSERITVWAHEIIIRCY